jgi:hypothetical protein
MARGRRARVGGITVHGKDLTCDLCSLVEAPPLFSRGAVHRGGIVFLLLALKMLGGGGEEDHHERASERDAAKIARYPLAVPYLLNPAGITVLVILSGAIGDQSNHDPAIIDFKSILT